jgi:hypothetical protein
MMHGVRRPRVIVVSQCDHGLAANRWKSVAVDIPPVSSRDTPALVRAAVVFRVTLRGFGRVVRRVVRVPMCDVRVMGRRGVVACVVMLLRFAMVLGRVLVMLRRLAMVLDRLLGHARLPGSSRVEEGMTNASTVARICAPYQHGRVSLRYRSDS